MTSLQTSHLKFSTSFVQKMYTFIRFHYFISNLNTLFWTPNCLYFTTVFSEITEKIHFIQFYTCINRQICSLLSQDLQYGCYCRILVIGAKYFTKRNSETMCLRTFIFTMRFVYTFSSVLKFWITLYKQISIIEFNKKRLNSAQFKLSNSILSGKHVVLFNIVHRSKGWYVLIKTLITESRDVQM